ncbi:predicted protein [Chaetomium globosum CBS 148.51]|uniref:Uncharacterized protein n=1 Tax=Chaetomium globosum (strain ATCC 6205 / CBS 148.51 / DSM 1962 / NBRC 6347 / NRRL 1970) TaxID=306901 RepID=Q2H553_CHAGB|nr:uncharacterized protein CHGG_06212 [Chaetomium globosum CBS 148.51]EAQ89593.1 predicted protein [Chaetomium globosum CBS 148.51]
MAKANLARLATLVAIKRGEPGGRSGSRIPLSRGLPLTILKTIGFWLGMRTMLTEKETPRSRPPSRCHRLDRHHSWAQGLPSCSTTLFPTKSPMDLWIRWSMIVERASMDGSG